LLEFENTVSALPFEEQRELVQLLVREIRVNRFEPEKGQLPTGVNLPSRQMRTQWYSVNIDFYAVDSLPTICTNTILSSHLKQNGRAGSSQTRTNFQIELKVGIPWHRYHLRPFVASPFHFSWDFRENRQPSNKSESHPRHPIFEILKWEQRLRDEPGLTRTQLAKDEGLTKARISQMLVLLNLSQTVRRHLTELNSLEGIKAFSLRRLSAVAKLPPEKQVQAFEKLRTNSIQSGL
jgi:hypothetical protein